MKCIWCCMNYPSEMQGRIPRPQENIPYMKPKGIGPNSLRSNMPAPHLATPKQKQRARTTEELMAEIEALKREHPAKTPKVGN